MSSTWDPGWAQWVSKSSYALMFQGWTPILSLCAFGHISMMETVYSCCWLLSAVPLVSKSSAAAAGGSAAFSYSDSHSRLPPHLPLPFPGETSMCSWPSFLWTHLLCEIKLQQVWLGMNGGPLAQCAEKPYLAEQIPLEVFSVACGGLLPCLALSSQGWSRFLWTLCPLDTGLGAQAARRTFKASSTWVRQYC